MGLIYAFEPRYDPDALTGSLRVPVAAVRADHDQRALLLRLSLVFTLDSPSCLHDERGE